MCYEFCSPWVTSIFHTLFVPTHSVQDNLRSFYIQLHWFSARNSCLWGRSTAASVYSKWHCAFAMPLNSLCRALYSCAWKWGSVQREAMHEKDATLIRQVGFGIRETHLKAPQWFRLFWTSALCCTDWSWPDIQCVREWSYTFVKNSRTARLGVETVSEWEWL